MIKSIGIYIIFMLFGGILNRLSRIVSNESDIINIQFEIKKIYNIKKESIASVVIDKTIIQTMCKLIPFCFEKFI